MTTHNDHSNGPISSDELSEQLLDLVTAAGLVFIPVGTFNDRRSRLPPLEDIDHI